MIDYREILRLASISTDKSAIARQVQSSRNTVASVLERAKEKKVEWPLEKDISNEELHGTLFPEKSSKSAIYTLPDFAWIHRELGRGSNLTQLWEEYCTKVHATGGVPYMYTQFRVKYERWALITKATMRITHKPGDAMQVDWAGDPLYITDSETGNESPAYLFVAVLPCSMYTYVEACSDMKTDNWLLCHVHAYEYFGGVARLLIPDNCKTATTSNTRYETILNRSYQELAEHYGTAIVPARVRKPDDKAAVENTVRFVSTWITASLRDRRFFAIAEVRKAVAEKLEELNRRPFKKRPGCRLSAFEQEEQSFLCPLPPIHYEPAIWTNPKVSRDYLISDGLNRYSVPFDLIGETVDVRMTRNVVEVFYRGTRVAVHVRLEKSQRDPIIKPEHMPEEHRKYLHYNTEEFIVWAAGVGKSVSEAVRFFLTSGKEAEQGYKSCISLIKLAERYGNDRLEDACGRILKLTNIPSVRNISMLCKSSLEQTDNVGIGSVHSDTHGITRGAKYYSRGGTKHD